MKNFKGLKLRYVLSFVVAATAIVTAVISGFLAMNILRQNLANNYLENNYNYAKKLSYSTGDLIEHMQQNIKAMSALTAQQNHQDDLDMWLNANKKYFNSVFITDTNGVIKIISPSVVQYNQGTKIQAGTKLESDAIRNALATQASNISDPYRGISGQLILLISEPIFDGYGNYKGLIGGTIYLESENAFKSLLSKHNLEDGSYVYVVDSKGRLIYHPDENRINELVTKNEVVNQVIQGKDGSKQIFNTLGKEYFAGFAFEEKSGWGIVSQTPTANIKEPLQKLMKDMLLEALPLLLIILILSFIFSYRLSMPLNKLAQFSEDAQTKNKNIKDHIKTNSSIYEVQQLYHHFNKHLDYLNSQIQHDALTGILNRRNFDAVINEWFHNDVSFSLIMFDIDEFKKVNDTFGHLTGDEVLKFVASILTDFTQDKILCFRFGGEEFGLLLKDKNETEAFKIAESLRKRFEESDSPTGEPITISLGISSFFDCDTDTNAIIERADIALYKSKSDGRNKSTIYKK